MHHAASRVVAVDLGDQRFAVVAYGSYDLARPALRTYTDADGLPENTIMAITVDDRGYLWVGTQDGAAFYNGRI